MLWYASRRSEKDVGTKSHLPLFAKLSACSSIRTGMQERLPGLAHVALDDLTSSFVDKERWFHDVPVAAMRAYHCCAWG